MAEKNQNDKTTKAKCLLRENFGLFATGVAVAATLQDGKSHFITINSLTSISLDPALLLFAIDNKSHKFESFTQNKNFSINLLTEDQIEISRLFSKVGDSEFDLEKLFFKSDLNNYILRNSLGYFECKRTKVVPAGDHHIIIGEITNFAKINFDKKPLIYFKGDYIPK